MGSLHSRLTCLSLLHNREVNVSLAQRANCGGEADGMQKKKGQKKEKLFVLAQLFLFELQSEAKREKQPSEAASVRGGSL